MRSLIIVALVLASLILGAATTLAVAWGFAYRRPEPYSGVGTLGCSHATGDGWMVRRWDERGSTRLHAMAVSEWVAGGKQSFDPGFVPRWSGFRRRPERLDETRLVDARGWPWRALSGYRTWLGSSTPYMHHSLEVDAPDSVQRTLRIARVSLPTRPLWAGLIADTILFGAAWSAFLAMILLGPILLKRFLRRRRGRCPMCAYDLRHDLTSGCPECGWRRSTSGARNAPAEK